MTNGTPVPFWYKPDMSERTRAYLEAHYANTAAFLARVSAHNKEAARKKWKRILRRDVARPCGTSDFLYNPEV